MAETKRIQLDAPKTLHREKKSKALPPTYRFEISLNDTNADCAEYSFAELVKEARTSENDSKQPGSDDPFSLDDDDPKLQEIARRLEEKYNPKPGRKRKKKLTVSEDYVDKGMGYDETDPFIDNDEAYDELVPSTLTTQFGGFYINKGDLEFRNLTEDGGYDIKVRKKRFKGIDKDGRKKRRLAEENQKRRGRKPLNDSPSALIIKPVKKTQPTVADMLQQHKAKLQIMQQEGHQQMELNPISIERDAESDEVEENNNKAPEAPVPVTGQGSTITEAIESVVKAAAEDVSNESAGPATGSSDGEEIKPQVENIEAPKLPDNLPPELDDEVSKLKEVAFKSEEGKCKFFSDEVNRMLLSIELKAQELTSAQRSIIYSHLASHLPCTKETLQKRAKKLRLDQEDGKLKEPMQKLKDGITAVMPEMLEKYAALLKVCDAKDGEKRNEIATGGSDGEDSQEEGDKKPSRVAKKHFEWNDTVRKYLCDVVRIKLKCYEVSKTRIQSAEEYLKHFLEVEVKNLWPPGWMQSRILFRESRAAHFYITNRPKKQIVVPKKSPLSSVMLSTKPAVSILNNVVSQESEFDQMFQDKSVPLIPPIENVLDRRENLDLLASNNGISAEERVAEYAKLFTLPIQSSVPDDLSLLKNQDGICTQTNNKIAVDLPTTSSSLLNTKTDSVVLSKSSTKSDKHAARLMQQSKLPQFPPKVSDYAAFAEGSLASDMLARIICASLADYPYSGSHNIESASSKTPSVISPNPGLIKEAHTLNSKFANDLHTSPKKLESGKSSTDKKKTSQEISSHMSGVGLNIESLLNIKCQSVSRQSDPGIIVKNKGLPTENSTAVNLKLKDSIVPHSRQFAEAFERTADTQTVSKKHSMKGHNVHPQSSPISSSSSSRLHNATEHLSDYPSSTSPRASLESAQKLALELASKYSTTQVTASAPYKKRAKYASSTKINDPWTQLFDASVGSSLLEGMKGFPFPVSLPTPPPAHSSSPHRTAAHSQHNSSRTSHISPGLRSIHEPKSDASNHNSQTHPNIISVSDVQRRQSLIQGPWKSSPSSQASSTSLSHFLASTSPPISNQCKPTSPNHHGSNSHVNMSPVPAHSMSQIEKVTPYSRSHSPLPPRASPSHLSAMGHASKTPPSNSYSHLGQTYSTHQSSHSVSPNMHQAVARNNIFDPSNSVNTSSTGPINLNPEMKTANPRTN